MASLSRVTDYQMTLLESFSHLALKKEIQAQQDLKVRTRNQKELQHAQFTENYFRCLDKVSSLDVFLSELANHAAANTTEMIDNAKEKTVDFSENLSQNLVQCWEWVTQTIHLAEIHVGHALDYQKFHFNADDLLTTLSKSSYLYYRYHSPSSPIPPSLEVQHLIPQLQEHINHLAHCKEQTDFLCNQAKDLVPVNLRVERLNSPQPGIWLCRYTNNSENISLEPHEQITVLDNSTASVWNIKTMKGQVIDVPAIGCLITGPELAANGKERNLREMIYRVYRAAYKAFSPEILRLMKGIAENFLANKLIIEDNHQKDFLTTLTEYNEILSSASTELNRDPSWLKAYDSCKDYIINKKSPRQVIAYGKQQFAGADLINQLRVMIRLLKDLRKLVVVLRRKLRPSDVSSEKSLTKEEMINSTLSLNNFTGSQLSLAPDQRQSKLYTQIKPYKNDSYNRWINVGPQMKKSVHLEIDASPKFRTRKVVTLKTSFKQMAVKKLEVSKVAINMNKRMVEDHSSFKKTFKDREGQSTGIFVEKKSSKTQLTQTDNQKKMQDFPTQTEGQVLLDDFSSYSKPKSMLSCGAQTTPVDQSCQSVQTNDQKKMQDLLTQTEGQVLLDDFSSYSKPKSMLTRGAQTTPIDQSSQFAQTDEKKETRAIQTNFSPTTQVSAVQTDDSEIVTQDSFFETPVIINHVAITQTDFKTKLLVGDSFWEGHRVVEDSSFYSIRIEPPKVKSISSQTVRLTIESAENYFEFDDNNSDNSKLKGQKIKWQTNVSCYEGKSTVVQDSSCYRIEKMNKRMSVYCLTKDFAVQFDQEKKDPEFGDISKELEEEIKENLNDLVSSGRRRNPDKICQTQTPTFISLGCQVAQTMTTEKGVDSIKSVYHEKGNQCDTKGQLINMKASQCVSETELTAQIRFKDSELQGLDVLKIENKLTSS